MEKEQAKAAADAQTNDVEQMKEQGYGLSKKRKIEQANDYWNQFGNGGDIFGQIVKKKSRLEVEKENAMKAKIQETEKTLKRDGSKKKGLVLMI